ncbi:MAG TPA: T9SS type A sorting domain-containing protein [Ignavibacteriaceae bacterium]|nr:T9SS type A sorting domain-containing protein [Ignavibacteriaceae bacterium]
MKNKILTRIFIIAIIAAFPFKLILSQHQIPYSVFGSGGDKAANSNYVLYSTAGEVLIDHSANSSHNQYQGFWYMYYEDVIVTVEDDLTMPVSFKLEQNYPNPFNPTTIIKFGVPVRSNVIIKIYDLLGSEVKTIANEEMDAGWYERTFNAAGLSSGVYIYRIEAAMLENQSEIFVSIKKMLLIK